MSGILIIGIGSTGKHICENLADKLNIIYGDYRALGNIKIKVLETAGKEKTPLNPDDFMHLTIQQDDFEDYKTNPQAGYEIDWSKWGNPSLISQLSGSGGVNAGPEA